METRTRIREESPVHTSSMLASTFAPRLGQPVDHLSIPATSRPPLPERRRQASIETSRLSRMEVSRAAPSPERSLEARPATARELQPRVAPAAQSSLRSFSPQPAGRAVASASGPGSAAQRLLSPPSPDRSLSAIAAVQAAAHSLRCQTQIAEMSPPRLNFLRPVSSNSGPVNGGSGSVVLRRGYDRALAVPGSPEQPVEPRMPATSVRTALANSAVGLAGSTDAWASVPIAETVTDRRGTGALQHHVADLDARFEYYFFLSARWVDMPAILGGQDWTPEVSSMLIPARSPDLVAPKTPSLEVLASENMGLAFQVRWTPSLTLRNANGVLPVPGARYQLKFLEAPRDVHGRALQPQETSWQIRPPVLEDATDVTPYECAAKLLGLVCGGTYRASVRIGDVHHWSPWSEPSLEQTLSVPPPTPSPGDVLELIFDGDSTADSARLEWRPFVGAQGLSRVEYKIMALEWPCAEQSSANASGGTVLARLRRGAADLAGGGPSGAGPRHFRSIGYVTRQCLAGPSAPLRSHADRLEWRTEGLRPGMYYKFFVCARYAALPTGALTVPPGLPAEAAVDPSVAAWPDEHCEYLQRDGARWEAALGRFGLWSDVVSTLHLSPYVVRGVSAGAKPSPAAGCNLQLGIPASSDWHSARSAHIAAPAQSDWSAGLHFPQPSTERWMDAPPNATAKAAGCSQNTWELSDQGRSGDAGASPAASHS